MTDEEHYDTPWEFLQRPTSVRLSTVDCPLTCPSPNGSPTMPHQFINVDKLVPTRCAHEKKRHSLRDKSHAELRIKKDDDIIVERNVDRVEAEKRLEGRETGDFLLRSRGEGSAALSLRGSSGILHIKLERRGDKWMIGEGPCFRSISAAISYYRRHPLPIRGSEHLILKKSLMQIVRL